MLSSTFIVASVHNTMAAAATANLAKVSPAIFLQCTVVALSGNWADIPIRDSD